MYLIEVLDVTGNLVRTNWKEFSADELQEFRDLLEDLHRWELFTLKDEVIGREWYYRTANIVSVSIVKSED